MMTKEILTASSMACALKCPRKYYYDYVIGLKPMETGEALKIGTAVHNGLEARAHGADFQGQYAAAIAGGTLDEMMGAKVFGILAAYDKRYGETEDRDYSKMDPEIEFAEEIAGSRAFYQRGKIDGIATLRDGRRVIFEHKTTSEELSETSGYWQRLRINPQLCAYAAAFGRLEDSVTCIYDVIRKPMIKPRESMPDKDENGLPVVLDACGARAFKRDGTPKKTADSAKGERMSTRAETAEEYGWRVLETLENEGEKYFQRREVTITADVLAEFKRERLLVCRMLLHFAAEARKAERTEYGWPRACSPDNCRNCPFAGFCLERIHADAENVPQGFRIAKHEELGQRNGEKTNETGLTPRTLETNGTGRSPEPWRPTERGEAPNPGDQRNGAEAPNPRFDARG